VNPRGSAAEVPTQDAGPQLAPGEFQKIRELAYRTFGLDLKSGKEELVSARLRRIVRDGGFRTFDNYYRSVVADTTGISLAAMIDALATNHTSFLREPDHFAFLRREVLPALAKRGGIDLWSAACSSGEEVWTLAIVLSEGLPGLTHRISASDISQRALAFADHGVYPVDRCQGLPKEWLSKYFLPEGNPPNAWRVSRALRAMASFRRLNLVQTYSWPKQFPIVFCRNVMIYFDRPTQERVIGRLTEYLEPGGFLFVGHAESLARVSHSLEYVQPAVYRKPERRKAWHGRQI
jgi:chemotaxis protein methyltransferase CheR